jgi:hypothetical protein
MRRISLLLNEQVLEEATRILGAKTYSAAVNAALEEVVRRKKIPRVADFFGSGIWEGNLESMREDDRVARKRRGRASG